MSWQVKYYWHYHDINNAEHTVNILENTEDVLTPVLCIAGDLAFETVYANMPHKFYPVRGCLGRFSLLSETDGQYTGLYTADPQKYKVNHYKGADLIGSFFFDSEFYSEPFVDIDNYFVTFSANDGFNLLERINYLTDSEEKYEGIVSFWTVIGNVLSKLALDWKAIYVGLSTSIEGVTLAADETIFHQQFAINDNYYNEDDKAETCRRVLEGILEPFGAHIEQRSGNLYITDPSYIDSDEAVTFKKYDAETFEYLVDVSINPKIGDLSDINFASSESGKDIHAGYNNQKIVYSPYRDVQFLKYEAAVSDFYTGQTPTPYGSGDYAWTETLFNDSAKWNKHNLGSFAKAISTAGSKAGEEKYYLKIDRYAGTTSEDNLSFTLKKQLPYIIPSAGYYLRIDISALFRTKTGYENPAEAGTALNYGVLFLKIKIGSKVYYKSLTGTGWRNEIVGGYNLYRLAFYNIVDYKISNDTVSYTYGAINDQYITAAAQKMYADRSVTTTPTIIPIGSGFSGDILEVTIYGWKTGNNVNYQEDDTATAATLDCRIDKVKLMITDSSGKEITNNDLEYEKVLEAKYKNERENITLIHGTNTASIPFERGGILGYNGTAYYYLQSWTREGFTSIIEYLLLRSVISNYKNPSVVISCSINLVDRMFGYLTYVNYLPGKKLMMTACTLNHADATASVTLTEFNKDNFSE